ncbi:PAS domain-containing protein [Streptomyces roseirectus]|uniref:PAS domain-containing protein n=1 Tax=Streptomyces roseirectus TaxID=2768066 RepID=A0A7H0IFY7_9ACTN|nr:PAS domain-containing protein [Streptomyces roseirectus]QNP71703.1 PAS domain-containing protein [Streptomyces roseirectus]
MSSRPSRGAARLAAILDALPDALVLVNANGTVVNANTIALEAFEAPGTALVGRGLLDLLPEFDSKLIPGSMRRPDHIDPRGRTKPARMTARRTDGVEFPVEVTSANLENGQQAYDGYGYAPDELLMLVVRDLSGTVDTEAELARSQRQTEMILRAASEGVVGTDTDGRIVLVNPAAAQILGYRASDLGGKELHTLVLHSRADGSPFPYDESPLADTLRSGRKHRVRGQVLFAKNGDKVSVDLTTAPVRDGDQLVGAVMTFTDRRPYDALAKDKETVEAEHTAELERLAEEHASDLTALRQRHVTEIEELTERHAEEIAAGEDRYAALGEREKDRYEALAGRHEQLLTLLGRSLRGPLDELRRELSTLAADDAGQLWPEANQVLHHLSAGYSRITTLIDNVLNYQLLDTGEARVSRTKVMLDAVVAAGVDGAVELIGPGRVQFAVHAPPIEAEVDARLLATALAHLVADVAGVDATGNAPVSAGGYMDNTVVVAAAQRGEVVRIEVRGPYGGGDPVHEPIVRGIVRAHGGVLQTVEVPGMSGSAYVLEVPLGGGAGAVPGQGIALVETPSAEEDAAEVSGRRRGRRSSVDAFLDGDEGEVGVPPASGVPSAGGVPPTGRRRRRGPAAEEDVAVEADAGSGRRRARGGDEVAEGAVVTAAEHAAGTAAVGAGLGAAVPPQGVPVPPGGVAVGASEQNALPPALPSTPGAGEVTEDEQGQPTGRRRRALAAAGERAAAQEAGPRAVFALPPAEADRGEEVGVGGAEGAVGVPGGGPVQGVAPAQGVVPVQGVGPVSGVASGQGGVPGQGVGPVSGVASGQGGVPGQGVGPVSGVAPGQGGVPGQGAGSVPGALPGQGVVAEEGAVPGVVPAQGVVPVQGVVPPQVAQVPQGAVPPQGVAVPPQGVAQQGVGQPGVPGQGVPGQQGVVAGQAAGQLPAQVPVPPQGGPESPAEHAGRHDAVPHDQADDHTPPQPHPASAPTGRRRRAVAVPQEPEPAETADVMPPAQPQPQPALQLPSQSPGVPAPGAAAIPGQAAPGVAAPAPTPPGVAVPGVTVPGQAAPGVTAPPHATPGSTAPGVTPPGTAAIPGQAVPGVAAPAPAIPGQAAPGVAAPAPATPGSAAPGVTVPGQAAPGVMPPPHATPGSTAPGVTPPGTAAIPGQAAPGVTAPPHATPGSTAPGVTVPPHATANPTAPGVTPSPQTGHIPLPSQPLPAEAPAPQPQPQPLPAEADPNSTQGRAISVRTLGQGVPFTRQAAQAAQAVQAQQPPQTATPPGGTPSGGRRRKLGTPPGPEARPHPPAEQPILPAQQLPHPSMAGQTRLAPGTEGAGRSYAIGAPDSNAAEGPEPLDGPGGAIEVADTPRPQPMDDELPPEPLDNPRRLLVWPAPDVTTQQALSDRGYRPVIVNSREEVDAQIAAFPAALFVDPLTGPITRTALQSLRTAAVAAEVPVLVTAGLGQATREAAYGADPAVLLKALAPRDSEQHPPRVLLIEEHAEIALALTATLERRGMQVARAASDADAVMLAGQFRPNLVVMDLMQVDRRQAGILDWLRANGQLNRTPLVVYTAAVEQPDLPRLASGETVLFLAERSTSGEVQSRIVDLLARIGTN